MFRALALVGAIFSLVFLCACAPIDGDNEEITEPESNVDTQPDELMSTYRSKEIFLDINEDGEEDYDFISSADYPTSSSTIFAVVKGGSKNNRLIDSLEATNLDSEDAIDKDANWATDSTQIPYLLADYGWLLSSGWAEEWQGSWVGFKESYLPVRISSNDNYYYGWVELSISKLNGILEISDYYLSTEENTLVLAGQKN